MQVGDDGAVTIEDLGSTNGTRVAGAFLDGARAIAEGEIAQVGAVQFVCVRNAEDDAGVVGSVGRRGIAPFNRPPRRMPPAPGAPVRLPAPPPEPRSGSRFGWAALLAPLLMGAVMALMWDPRLALFALLTPIMMIGNWIEDRRRVKRERKRGGADFRRRLAALEVELTQAQVAERERQLALLPDPAEVVRRAERPSTRLWERRPGHDDFMYLRLGVGRWAGPRSAGRRDH